MRAIMGSAGRAPPLPQPAMLPPSATLYKVFLVEDEIVAREGIRDTVAWNACGFRFVGEAPDGEAALPLIQQTQPDLIITDIRMPFMDGLQLTRLVRARLPQTRIVILSGYDEFAYAQAAIALGVSEYMLKPVSAHDIEQMLIATRARLDHDRAAAEARRQLTSQVEDTRALQRQELLMRLCLGDVDPYEALERSRELGIEIAAPCYAVAVARVLHQSAPADGADAAAGGVTVRENGAHGPRRLQRLQTQLLEACAGLPAALPFRKDIEEVVVLLRAADAAAAHAALDATHAALDAAAQRLAAGDAAASVQVVMGAGGVQPRLSDLPLSFATALDAVAYAAARSALPGPPPPAAAPTPVDAPVQLDRRAAGRYLRFGAKSEFDAFFDDYTAPLDARVLAVRLVRDYLLMDLAVAAANCVRELGGNPAEVVPDAAHLPALAPDIHSLNELRTVTRRIFDQVLDFRDAVARQQHRRLLLRARAYIEQHAAEPELGLHAVAAHVNVSPSHFSAIFSRETGTTFKEFLTRIRMEQAQTLLRTTALSVVEIALRSGYSDPHYFSAAFKRVTGVSPREFREARTTTTPIAP